MPKPCLVTALPIEAKPLVDHYGLRSAKMAGLSIYDGDNVRLLQCGLGKLSATAATSLFMHLFPHTSGIVNVGIAGAALPIGTVVLAHTVQDDGSERNWYPHLPAKRNSPQTEIKKVLTFDKPCDQYSSEHVNDMEASGIFSAACPSLNTALVHSIKVVSDNEQSSWENINKKQIQALITQAIPALNTLLAAIPASANPAHTQLQALCNELTTQLHFTQTERHALKDKLQKHLNLFEQLPEAQSLLALGNAKSIRVFLDKRLDGVAPTY